MSIVALLLSVVLALASCASVATVSEIVPRRPGFETAAREPLAALARHVEAAERAWRALGRDPAAANELRDYNYAVARIMGTLRESKLAPWSAPCTGRWTLDWQPHPLPVWDPRPYELIPTDQLVIGGTYMDVREVREGLGAPLVAKRVANPVHDYAATLHFLCGHRDRPV
jgi:hypothetical protein